MEQLYIGAQSYSARLVLLRAREPRVRSFLENLKLRPCCIDRAIARSMRLGRGLKFSCKDRTEEVIKLFIIWLVLQEKIFIEAEVGI